MLRMLQTVAVALAVGAGLEAQLPPRAKTTQVLATLTVKAGANREEIMKTMPQEVKDTVQLHLDGHIAQWYARSDGKGVVFLLNCSSVEDARKLLDELPLIKEKLASFEYMALGPLTPLRVLLNAPKAP